MHSIGMGILPGPDTGIPAFLPGAIPPGAMRGQLQYGRRAHTMRGSLMRPPRPSGNPRRAGLNRPCRSLVRRRLRAFWAGMPHMLPPNASLKPPLAASGESPPPIKVTRAAGPNCRRLPAASLPAA